MGIKHLTLINWHKDLKFEMISLVGRKCLPASWALWHPGTGLQPKGNGVGDPASTHCCHNPSLQPWAMIQSVVAQVATMKKVVMKQHVKAITYRGRHDICKCQSLKVFLSLTWVSHIVVEKLKPGLKGVHYYMSEICSQTPTDVTSKKWSFDKWNCLSNVPMANWALGLGSPFPPFLTSRWEWNERGFIRFLWTFHPLDILSRHVLQVTWSFLVQI